jgi:predicted phage baseplate assembly protein
MSLQLPNLDDRRWADLVEEARALIPTYAPDWTDHNAHDPGITLLELFAWVAEMDIYQLNRIPEQHKRKFLALLGLRPEPPRPARTVLSFTLQDNAAPLPLPATVEFEGNAPLGEAIRFRTLDVVTVVPSDLKAIQFEDSKGLHDLTPRWQRGEPVKPFGDDPQPGMALYLGFNRALPVNVPVSLFCMVTDLQAGEEERVRLIAELKAQAAACRPPDALLTHQQTKPDAAEEAVTLLLPHHSVGTVWEFLVGQDQWQRLEPTAGEIVDETRAFTLNGRILVKLPVDMAQATNSKLHYLRCRFAAGSYDAVPQLQSLAMNAVLAEQASVPAKLTEAVPDHPDLKAEFLGRGTGLPWQQVTTSEQPVLESSFRLFTVEDGEVQLWMLRSDFAASGRADAHFLLDPTQGVVTFGDGEKGRTISPDATILASYLGTRAEAGNLAARTVKQLANSAHNKAVLANVDDVKAKLASITNPIPALGGTATETLGHAEGRAVELMEKPNRAVTLADYEAFARETPGVRTARVSAKANLHTSFPCLKTPGIITVIILPYLPVDRPMPSRELRQQVAAYLKRRRVIGTRVEVVGPTYREVAVRAKVQAYPRLTPADIRQKITAALNRFFHPLHGGPDKQGWPFGRDVYRSEVLQVVDETEGVDHVLSLELLIDGGEPQCGNVCLGPTGLVAVGQHQIEVV